MLIELDWKLAEPHGLFFVGAGPDGKHYAARNSEPFFCVSGETPDDAARAAGAAIGAVLRLRAPARNHRDSD